MKRKLERVYLILIIELLIDFFYYILIINNYKLLINLIVDWKVLLKCFNLFIYYKDGCLNF